MRRGRGAIVAVLLGVCVAGCGEVSNTITPDPGTANVVKVMLAGQPNAYYVGLYEAQALGYFKASDIDLEIEVPSAGQDPVQLLHDGDLTLAFASMPTVLLHRNQDEPVVGIAAITDVPLPSIKITASAACAGAGGQGSGGAALTATSTTTTTAPQTSGTPASTTGTCTSATGATTTTGQAAAGGATTTATSTSPTTTVGAIAPGTTMTAKASPSQTTPNANTATVAATTTSPTTTAAAQTTTVPEPDTVLWPETLKSLINGGGVPDYDGLVVVARKGSIVNDAPVLRRFVQALARGYRAARADPAAAVQNLIVQVPALAGSAQLQVATVQAALPHFFPTTGKIWGWQAPALWNTFGTWMMNNHVINNPNALTDASTNELLQGEGV